MLPTKETRYSQNNEEDFILDYFDGRTGKFLDIGAYDVFKFSNTRALFERGWSGILVEPSPENYKAIAGHYKDEPRIEVLNCAVGDRGGEIDFYASDDAVSTTDEKHRAKWEAAGVKYRKIKVNQVNVIDFMNQYCKGIDFLSVDTEATNIVLFRMIPDWVFEQISLFCIEHDGNREEIEARLKRFGFSVMYYNGENILLGK
jgi:FkbM family methyltransferase